MTAASFDTLKFVQRLKASGVPEAQAEAFVEAFQEAQGEAEFATKTDIAELRQATKADIAELRQATKADIAELKTELKTDLAELDKHLAVAEERNAGHFKLLHWMIGFNLALTVIVLARLFNLI